MLRYTCAEAGTQYEKAVVQLSRRVSQISKYHEANVLHI